MRSVCVALGFCLLALPAAAQAPRVTISAGVVAQPATATFTDVMTFTSFAEPASIESGYEVADGIAFDIGGAVRVWQRLSAGVAITRLTRDTSAITKGSFPHPFFFNIARTGVWTSDSLDRTETAVHVSAALELLQKDPRLSLSVFGGPTWFSYAQAVVESVDLIQSYPYDTIDARLVTGRVDGSALGFNVGANFGWYFTRTFGIGALVRFTQATKKDVHVGSGDPFDLELGGFQGGGGVRIRF